MPVIRGGVLLLVLCLLPAIAVAGTAEIRASVEAAGRLQEVEASTARILRQGVENGPQAAVTCLAAAALVPTKGQAAQRRLVETADYVLAASVEVPRRTVGVRVSDQAEETSQKNCAGPGTLDAFSDKTCNDAQTRYAIWTAYGGICLAHAHRATGDVRYREGFAAILESWTPVGAWLPECKTCFYFWYSDHPNDTGRYVRNTSVLMGAAYSWAWKILQDERYLRLAQGVANAEDRELRHGNLGYFGIDDPRWQRDPAKERVRIENHVPLVAWGLHEIGLVTGSPAIMEAGLERYRQWRTCPGGQCERLDCARWAGRIEGCSVTQTVTACLFLGASPELDRDCVLGTRQTSSFSPVAIFFLNRTAIVP